MEIVDTEQVRSWEHRCENPGYRPGQELGASGLEILDTEQVRSWEHPMWKSWIPSRSGAGSIRTGNPGYRAGQELGAPDVEILDTE